MLRGKSVGCKRKSCPEVLDTLPTFHLCAHSCGRSCVYFHECVLFTWFGQNRLTSVSPTQCDIFLEAGDDSGCLGGRFLQALANFYCCYGQFTQFGLSYDVSADPPVLSSLLIQNVIIKLKISKT